MNDTTTTDPSSNPPSTASCGNITRSPGASREKGKKNMNTENMLAQLGGLVRQMGEWKAKRDIIVEDEEETGEPVDSQRWHDSDDAAAEIVGNGDLRRTLSYIYAVLEGIAEAGTSCWYDNAVHFSCGEMAMVYDLVELVFDTGTADGVMCAHIEDDDEGDPHRLADNEAGWEEVDS